jgi:hypothetical protein
MYGVLLWEILTFAREQPFESLTDEKVIENIGHIYQDSKKHVRQLNFPSFVLTQEFQYLMAQFV